MKPTTIISAWLVFQAVAVAAWWCVLLCFPESIRWFQPRAWPKDALLSFWLSDILLFVIGSPVVAVGVALQRPWSAIAIWSLAISAWYPTLYCLTISFRTGEAWLAAAAMVSMSGLTTAMATIHGNSQQVPAAYRVIRMEPQRAMAWTAFQVLIFWGTFLLVIPKAIVELEQHFHVESFQFVGLQEIAIAMFLMASGLGIWSGITMALKGEGTPLPTATAAELVISGPYRWIRNPMATAGILQGLAVGLGMGSYAVLVYSCLGAILWHLIARPSEEQDLLSRFGESYRQYRRVTGLWLPFLFRSRT